MKFVQQQSYLEIMCCFIHTSTFFIPLLRWPTIQWVPARRQWTGAECREEWPTPVVKIYRRGSQERHDDTTSSSSSIYLQHTLKLLLGPGSTLKKKNWVGVCGPLPKTLTLFMSKICDIPYPISDLTKNSKPNLWPDSDIKILFQTCIIISSVIQTNFKLP